MKLITVFQLLILSFAFNAFGYNLNCKNISIKSVDINQLISEVEQDYHVDNFIKNIELNVENAHKLKLSHHFSILLYTDYMYKNVNQFLREQRSIDNYITYVKTLCSALNGLPDYRGEVHRVVNLPGHIVDKYEVGKVILERAFVSSSADEIAVNAFRTNTDQSYNTIFYITSKTGKDISKISKWPDEKEVLFRAGTKFKVTKKYTSFFTRKTFIWLEESEN